jgi:lysine decarboxylase
VDIALVAQILSLLQSTSPSVLLTASLDAARRQIAVHGKALLDRAIQLGHMARREIRQIRGLWCYGEDLLGSYGIHTFDPTKLVIRVSDLGITGREFARLLRARFMVEIEFADPQNLICSITIADDEERVLFLIDAIRAIAQGIARVDEARRQTVASPPAAAIALVCSGFAPSTRVKFGGLWATCAPGIIPYPPRSRSSPDRP